MTFFFPLSFKNQYGLIEPSAVPRKNDIRLDISARIIIVFILGSVGRAERKTLLSDREDKEIRR